eukprot:TRINITY_DN10495_c0_g1_i3.p1 TRINITY_DN10495_c0_g1~~TRINITY_DN10495_c0_g1_i3.p1  ORF type:complete len:405 (+),score=53.25 TRINITY_DN10495_c0_g1_i3:84-1298(+)
MKHFTILILYLLCVSISYAAFTWNKVINEDSQKRIQFIAHQSDTNGNMYMFWEKQNTTGTRQDYLNIMKITHDAEDSEAKGFERTSVQVSSSGRTMFVAYYGCLEGTSAQNLADSVCGQVFSIDSTDSGKTWTQPKKVATRNVRFNFAVPISTIQDKESGDIFVFFATKTNDPYTSEIVVYHRRPGERSFELVATLPNMRRLVTIGAGYTIDSTNLKRYLHLFASNYDTVYYTRSVDDGKSWSKGLYNFMVIDTKAKSGSLYVQYRSRLTRKLLVSRSRNHGQTFESAMIVGESPRPSRDAIGICGSDADGESLVVSSYVDFRAEDSSINVLFKNKSIFTRIPYPFTKTTGTPMMNLMIDCAYRGSRQFFITAAIFTGLIKDQVYIAHGTLNLADDNELIVSEQ